MTTEPILESNEVMITISSRHPKGAAVVMAKIDDHAVHAGYAIRAATEAVGQKIREIAVDLGHQPNGFDSPGPGRDEAMLRQLFELLDAMVQRWPHEGSFDDCSDLAGILGVKLWTQTEPDHRMRFGPVPDGMDISPESTMGADTDGWEMQGLATPPPASP